MKEDVSRTDASSDMEYSLELDSETEISTQTITAATREVEYGLEKFRNFLKVTKGKRNVVVDKYFPDRTKFIEMWEMMDSEIVFCLKKFVQKVCALIRHDDVEELQ